MSHPRDPRARRERRDPLAAAVALELAADSMRAHLTTPEPEPGLPEEHLDPAVLDQVAQWDTAAALAVDLAGEEADDAPDRDLVDDTLHAIDAARAEAEDAAALADDDTGQPVEPAPLVPEPALGTGAYRDHYFPWVAGGQVPDLEPGEARCGNCGAVTDLLPCPFCSEPEPPAPPVPPAAPAHDETTIITPDLARAVLGPVYGNEHPPAPAPYSPEAADELVKDLVHDLGAFSRSEHPPASWRSVHDPRSLAFGVDRLFAGAGPLQDVRLPTGPVLDQLLAGATLEEQSCCTGCGTVAARNVLGRSEPMDGRFPALDLDDAERVYDRARQVDEYLGDHTTGSSVLGAMKAAVDLGLIGGYLWCFGTRAIAQTLIQKRLPVVVGVRWTSGMWQTGPGGLVVLDGDPNQMGHCLAVVGLSLKGPQAQPGPFFVWQNSAGESYGDGGFGYVHHRDLSRLLRGVGEAAVPMLTPQAPQ